MKVPGFLRARLASELDRGFAAGSLGALTIRVFGTGGLLLLYALLTRLLGSEEFGHYIYVLSWVNVLALVAACGLDTASLRFVAAYDGTADRALLRGFVRRSAQIVLAASIAFSGLLATAAMLLGDRVSPGLKSTLVAACPLLPAAALLLLLASWLRGFRRVAMAMAPQFLLRPLLLAVAVCALFLTGARPSAAGVMAMDVMVSLALLAVMVRVLRRKALPRLRPREHRFETRRWIAAGLPMLAVSGLRMAMAKVDILVLGFLLGTTVAGVYAIAAQLASLISFGLFAVNMVAAPLIAQLHAQERRDDLQRIVRLGALATLGFSLVTGACLVLFGKTFLRLFGPAFVEAYVPLCVLVLAQIVNSSAGSVGFIMTMTTHEREAAAVTALTLALDVLLAVTLIPRFGALGAAVATATAEVAWNVILVARVKRHVNINSTAFATVST